MLKHITLGLLSSSFISVHSIEIELGSRVLEKASAKYFNIIKGNLSATDIHQRRGPQTEQETNVKTQLNPVLIETLSGYGCWCYFDGNTGRSQPQDSYDSICKILTQSYECATIEIDGCLPWNEPYNELTVDVETENVFTLRN